MNLIIIAVTYVVLAGLVILLTALIRAGRKSEYVEINDTILGPEDLEKHAVELARNHVVDRGRRNSRWLIPRLNDNFSFISETYKALNDDIRNMFATDPAAEWLLDNFYIIEEQYRDIKKNLSKGYYSQLPVLKTGYLSGYPRVYAVALEVVAHTDGRIDEKVLTNFIRAYQSQTLLSIGELWALAIMLRIALIENIRHICEKIIESQHQWHKAEEMAERLSAGIDGEADNLFRFVKDKMSGINSISPSFVEHLLQILRKQGGKVAAVAHYLDERLVEQNSSTEIMTGLEHQLQAARQVSLGNTITSLRLVSNIDWSDIFETLSHVEHILRQDPAGVYQHMDFESRDYYRHQVEKLSKKYDTTEINVARKAVECAAENAPQDDSENALRHLGYYLVGRGRKCLEEKIEFRPYGIGGIIRALKAHPSPVYIGSIVLITAVTVICFVCYGYRTAGLIGMLSAILIGLLLLVPASELAITLVNCIVSHIFRPFRFPKLELGEGIPEEFSSMVIIPTLLPNEKRVIELLGQLETFYLANREEHLYFALVGDYKDAVQAEMPDDDKIIKTALDGVKELNRKYTCGGKDIFFYFHRHRQYNDRQRKWMGRERKRGAIIEFNSLMLGNGRTSYTITSTKPGELPKIKYIITLDADTNLPMGAARRLIGTMSHPMNRPVIDKEKGIVVDGYGLLQPRISVSVSSANSTLFSRIFAGQGGIDPYTTTVSDVYQDVFGEGIFTGKGIYDLNVFQSVLGHSIPENTVLSHDLLEGCYLRAGLLTDVEMVDGYPARYNAYAMRLHRWVRGDWQLIPWLGRTIRDESGKRVRNPLSLVSKWKILDNLRRSLINPVLMLLIAMSFGILPGNTLVWLGLALITAAAPVISFAINSLLSMKYRVYGEKRNATIICGFRAVLYQTVLMFIFIPYQAYLMTDAIVKTLGRVFFTRRNLLEWVTAADMEANLKNDLKSFWKRMWISVFLGLVVLVLAVVLVPGYVLLAVLILCVFSAAPIIAYAISKPYTRKRVELSSDDISELRRLARKTWRYFEDLAGAAENYLPTDNYQEDPPRGAAHRTSPTNIGLLLVSTMSARDLGYIGTVEMIERLANTISTIERMDKWNGHLYNWYDTITLETLKPLYVSTVDSGNLIGYLMVLEQGLREYLKKPLVDSCMAQGIKDTLNLLMEDIKDSNARMDTSALDKIAAGGKVVLENWIDALNGTLCEISRMDDEKKLSCPLWENKVISMINSFKEEASGFIPLVEFAGSTNTLIADALQKCSDNSSLTALSDTYTNLLRDTENLISEKSNDEMTKLREEVRQAQSRIQKVKDSIGDLIERVRNIVQSMKFAPLFDPKRQLFAIGYNVEDGHLSKSYYDLLASEARQTSYIAVARGEVEQRHWFRLGRMLTRIDGYKGLVSWTGTMFEYLMPLLIMRNYENTLLDETYYFVVENQIKYAKLRNIPWGISESGFSAFDINLNYQYKAFGVPELGLKRGLGNDLVIAPYATVIALPVNPAASVRNIRRLKDAGADADYGMYEAIDYTPSRLHKNSNFSIVKSFMAHHQGMSFIALNNYLNDNIMQKRFHADPIIKSAELLLQERVPVGVAFNKEHKIEESPVKKNELEDGEVIRTYGIPDSQLPRVHILSNGSYSVMVTNGGSGYSRNKGIAVSRWKGNFRNSSGLFIYVQNINSNIAWSATYEPYNVEPDKYSVVFSPDKAEFIRKDDNIETHTEITVSPEDNAEIRRLSITNRSRHSRVIEVTSYFEVVLAHQDADMAHPAFSNLFVRTEFVPDHDCLLASRRPRSEKERPLWAMHTVTVEGELIGNIQYETDRFKFIGRGRDLSDPAAMDVDQPLTNTVGAVLDPVMSIRRRVRIAPGQTVRVSFAVAISETRKNALELAEKYHDPKIAERIFELAWTSSQVESRYLGFKAKDVEQYLNMIPGILYPGPHRRKLVGYITRNTKGQPDLWPFGISGDVPIVLAVLSDKEEIYLVNWLLKAHEYWRMKGLTVDLVILLGDESSYIQPLLDLVRDTVMASHARDIQDRMGGVFIRSAKLMSEQDIILFYSAARLVLKGNAGPVKEQLKPYEEDRALTGFIAQSINEEKLSGEMVGVNNTQASAPSELRFFNGVGGFNKECSEYIITLREGQHTPAPWINVLSNEKFGCIVSESGSGYTWSENSRENKLTPWSNDPVSDIPGEVFYLRDELNGDFWSITPLPIREKESYVIRHGFGYSVFEHISHGIEQKLTIFVPEDDPIKVCIVSLKNVSGMQREITATYFVRPVLGVNDQVTAQYITTQPDEDTGMLRIKNVYNTEFPDRIAFMDVSEKQRFFTGDRFEFVGLNRSLKEPEAMKRERLSGRTGAGFDPCAALQIALSLGVGEEKQLVFVLGQAENASEAARLSGKYASAANAQKELKRVREFWDEKLRAIQVSTPDNSMDIMLNGWLQYQVISCRMWSRSAFYQSGGAYGFRDQLQDSMAVVYTWPELTRRQILLHSSRQFTEGDVQHWWHPGVGKGIRTKYSDDLLWLAYVTADYIRCTDDWSILGETTNYLEGALLKEHEDEKYDIPSISKQTGTLYEHCIRAIERALKFGDHCIPLMGSGDWNDGMNTVGNKGKGESVWLGWFLYVILRRFVPICMARNDGERAERYSIIAGEIIDAIEKNAWDGSWYRRAYFDDGTPLGSIQNPECRIDSLSQSWAAISGAAKTQRVEEAMNAVEKYLVDRDEGIIKLLTPPFDASDLEPGYIKGYVPGVRENGGQYTHAAIWVIYAFSSIGKGDKAWELFHLINPINHARTQIELARYKVEPYAVAADVLAVAPHAGRGGWTWYTGAAGWVYRAGIEHILGIKKAGHDIRMDPCIPRDWNEYSIKYKFGRTLYDIRVKNPDGVNKGVKVLTIDGKTYSDNVIKLADDGKEHSVEVLMGRKD